MIKSLTLMAVLLGTCNADGHAGHDDHDDHYGGDHHDDHYGGEQDCTATCPHAPTSCAEVTAMAWGEGGCASGCPEYIKESYFMAYQCTCAEFSGDAKTECEQKEAEYTAAVTACTADCPAAPTTCDEVYAMGWADGGCATDCPESFKLITLMEHNCMDDDDHDDHHGHDHDYGGHDGPPACILPCLMDTCPEDATCACVTSCDITSCSAAEAAVIAEHLAENCAGATATDAPAATDDADEATTVASTTVSPAHRIAPWATAFMALVALLGLFA